MKYRDRLRVWESDYGRSEGWDLELDGKTVALLDDPQLEDMFWISYRLTPTTDDPVRKELLMSETFWEGDDWLKLVYRSRATGLVAEHPFPAPGFVGPHRLSMRALCIAVEGPRPWDWVVLKARSLLRLRFRLQTKNPAKQGSAG